MHKREQTEDFEVTDNVLYNFLPEEQLVYKMKIRFFTKVQIILVLFLFLIPICIITMIYSIFVGDFLEYFLFPAIAVFIFFPIAFIYSFKMSKPLEFFIYLSNKKIYMFGELSPLNYTKDVIELSSLQAVIMRQTDPSEDKGKIEFICQYFDDTAKPHKKYSRITPYIKDISKIFQIFESAILHYGNVRDKLKLIDNKIAQQNFHNFYNIDQSLALNIYSDKIIFTKDSITTSIKFNSRFYLTYKLKTIIIKSSYSKKLNNLIEFGPIDDFLNILELIYLKFLSWKDNRGVLLNAQVLLDFQERWKLDDFKIKANKDEVKLKSTSYSEKKLTPFLKNLKKDENILIVYFPTKKLDLLEFITLLSLILVFFYFINFSFITLSILNSSIFFGICLIILLFGIKKFIQKYIRYTFTSSRIILGYKKKIYFTPYNNVLAITYQNKIIHQNIEIHLKNPIEGLNLDSRIKISIDAPKRLNLYLKILQLRNIKRKML